jgi:metallophosphoesterase (TIGR00282 family)
VTQTVRILFIGDVVGGPGRRALQSVLPALREQHAPQFVVVNAENAAGGVGITSRVARDLFAWGVDVITLGNHAYRHREVYTYLDEEERIIRPANFLRTQPGHGSCVVTRDGLRLGVISLSGNLFMKAGRPAFLEADSALAALEGQADHVVVDMHAEATSEKVGLGWYLDGRVTAVVGTHTHVPTADARVLPGGTAYITDVGMTGARAGVLGVKRELAIEAMRTQMPVKFETASEDPWVNGVVIEASGPMRASAIQQVLEPAKPAPPLGHPPPRPE